MKISIQKKSLPLVIVGLVLFTCIVIYGILSVVYFMKIIYPYENAMGLLLEEKGYDFEEIKVKETTPVFSLDKKLLVEVHTNIQYIDEPFGYYSEVEKYEDQIGQLIACKYDDFQEIEMQVYSMKGAQGFTNYANFSYSCITGQIEKFQIVHGEKKVCNFGADTCN
jgi:hypothetical protein